MSRIDPWGLEDHAVMLSGVGASRVSAGLYLFTSITDKSAYYQAGAYATSNLPSGGVGIRGDALAVYKLFLGGEPYSVLNSGYRKVSEFTQAFDPKALVTQPGKAIFYSGITDGVPARQAAQEIAGLSGGKTIDMLLKEKGITAPALSDDRAWEALSKELAENASGDLSVVLGQSVREGSTWEKTEFPTLKTNPRVRSITAIDPSTRATTLIYQREKGETEGMADLASNQTVKEK